MTKQIKLELYPSYLQRVILDPFIEVPIPDFEEEVDSYKDIYNRGLGIPIGNYYPLNFRIDQLVGNNKGTLLYPVYDEFEAPVELDVKRLKQISERSTLVDAQYNGHNVRIFTPIEGEEDLEKIGKGKRNFHVAGIASYGYSNSITPEEKMNYGTRKWKAMEELYFESRMPQSFEDELRTESESSLHRFMMQSPFNPKDRMEMIFDAKRARIEKGKDKYTDFTFYLIGKKA